MAMDGLYADNAGAGVGDAMDGLHAGNAGAVAGRVRDDICKCPHIDPIHRIRGC